MTLSTAQPPPLDQLSDYAIDPRTGFVPCTDPLERLPAQFDAWEVLVPTLSPMIRASTLRAALAALDVLDPMTLASERERERSLLLLTVFANGWVWCGPEVNLRIPRQISVPLCAVAAALDRPPIVHYASMALHNWRRIDPNRTLSADNMCMQVQFLGGVDEDWFFIASLGVELAGAALLPHVHAATIASHRESDAKLAGLLEQVGTGMLPVRQALGRMREWCDPYIFYHRVRPFLAGWPTPGALYEDVWPTPMKYFGGSAGQSSLIQAIDAMLGVSHGESTAGAYLREVRRYMPRGHRRFVVDVERASRIHARASHGSRELRDAYNAVIEQVELFRKEHMALAHDYVTTPSGIGTRARGTGGTALAQFLAETHNGTSAMKIPR